MKREDVRKQIPGITDEQLDWLMAENGRDVQREKSAAETVPVSALPLRKNRQAPTPWGIGLRFFQTAVEFQKDLGGIRLAVCVFSNEKRQGGNIRLPFFIYH